MWKLTSEITYEHYRMGDYVNIASFQFHNRYKWRENPRRPVAQVWECEICLFDKH